MRLHHWLDQLLEKIFLTPYQKAHREYYHETKGVVMLFAGITVLLVIIIFISTMKFPLRYTLYGMLALSIGSLFLFSRGYRIAAQLVSVYGFWVFVTIFVFFSDYFDRYGVYKLTTFYLFLIFITGLAIKRVQTTFVLTLISLTAVAADYLKRPASPQEWALVEIDDYIACIFLLILTALIIHTLTTRASQLLESAQKEAMENQQRAKELRTLRNYLSNIIDAMPSILVSVNANWEITLWNKEAERFTGIAVAQAEGRHLREVLSFLEDTLSTLERAVANNERGIVKKRARTVMFGDTRYMDVTVYTLTDDGENGAVIRLDDVTRQMRIEEQIIHDEKMRSVGGLAAGMAHEINNPLAGVVQNSAVIEKRLRIPSERNLNAAEKANIDFECLQTYLEDRSILKMLSMIQESGFRAAEIVQNMLGFSRKSNHEYQSVFVQDLLEQALTLISTEFDIGRKQDFRRIDIHRAFDSGAPPVNCEPGKILQVMINILRNGAQAMYDATASGSMREAPLFVLSTFHTETHVGFEIKDNGPGMDESVRKRIFEPFFTTKDVGTGTGLGLAISFFIVTEQHQGEMTVDSVRGKGSRFKIQLPRHS